MKNHVDEVTSRKKGEKETEEVASSSLLAAKVSYYHGVDPKNKIGEKPLRSVIDIIRTESIPTEDQIRTLNAKLDGLTKETPEYKRTRKQYEALKEKLVGFTPSGICLNGRNNPDLTDYN